MKGSRPALGEGAKDGAPRNVSRNGRSAFRGVMDDEGRASFSMEFSHFEPKRT